MDAVEYIEQLVLAYNRGESTKRGTFTHALREHTVEAFAPIAPRLRVHMPPSFGQGSAASVPMIALVDRDGEDEVEKGIYVCLLFDTRVIGETTYIERFYLTLNQGVTQLNRDFGFLHARNVLSSRARKYRAVLDGYADDLLPAIEFQPDTDTARLYEAGNIVGKCYDVTGEMPTLAELKIDIARFSLLLRTVGDDEKWFDVERARARDLAELQGVDRENRVQYELIEQMRATARSLVGPGVAQMMINQGDPLWWLVSDPDEDGDPPEWTVLVQQRCEQISADGN